MKVLIIGAGNMGKTYARSFLASRFIDANDLYILERSSGSVAGIKEIPQGNIIRRRVSLLRRQILSSCR